MSPTLWKWVSHKVLGPTIILTINFLTTVSDVLMNWLRRLKCYPGVGQCTWSICRRVCSLNGRGILKIAFCGYRNCCCGCSWVSVLWSARCGCCCVFFSSSFLFRFLGLLFSQQLFLWRPFFVSACCCVLVMWSARFGCYCGCSGFWVCCYHSSCSCGGRYLVSACWCVSPFWLFRCSLSSLVMSVFCCWRWCNCMRGYAWVVHVLGVFLVWYLVFGCCSQGYISIM